MAGRRHYLFGNRLEPLVHNSLGMVKRKGYVPPAVEDGRVHQRVAGTKSAPGGGLKQKLPVASARMFGSLHAFRAFTAGREFPSGKS